MTPAPVTVTAQSSSKAFGTADPTFAAKVTGMVNGESDELISYEVSRPGAGTDEAVGTYKGAIVATGEAAQGNYSVTYVPADFTILTNTTDLGLTAESNGGVYTGSAYGLKNVAATGPAADGATIEYKVGSGEWTTTAPTATDVADSMTGISVRASKTGYQTVQIDNLTLTVTQRQVILTSGSASKVYDEHPLTNGNVTVTGDGFVTGEGATYNVYGSQTLIGDSPNYFNYTLKSNTKADNYDITKVEGTLEVTGGTATKPLDPGFVVTKTHESKTYGLGDTITFIVKVTNIYDEAKDITLTEIAGFYFTAATGNDKQTLTLQGVEPGQTKEVEVTHVVTEDDILNGGAKHEIKNTVTATLENKSYQADDTAVLAAPNAHMTVSKKTTSTPKNGDSYALGETITYEITVTNDGNLTLTDVVVSDVLTGDEWTIDELKPGETSEAYTASYVVTEDDILAGTVKNVATAEGEGPDGNDPEEASGTTEDDTDEKNADLSVVKSIKSVNGSAVAGDSLVTLKLNDKVIYQITVTNTGNVTMHDITVEDELTGQTGDNAIAIEGELAPGESATVTTAEYIVTEDDIKAGQVSNAATANGSDPEEKPNPGPDSGETVDPTEEKDSSLFVKKTTKTVNGEDFTGADLLLGDEVVYEVSITNNGNITIDDVVLEDEMTDNTWNVGTMKPGDSKTFETDPYTVTEADILAGVVKNHATATGNTTDPEPEDPDNPIKVTPGDTEDPTEEVDSTIVVKKTATSAPANGEAYAVGETITYEITATNTGNLTMTDVVVTDELTGDEWTIDELKPGETSETFTTSYVVTDEDVLAGTVLNVATVTGGNTPDPEIKPEPEPGTDEKPTVDPKGSVNISKKATSTPDNGRLYVEGERISYEITATNTGTLTVNNLVVTDDLTGDKWTVKALAPGESKTFKATYTVKASDVRKGEVVNVATGSGSTVDPETPPTVVPGDTTDPTGTKPTPGPGIAPDDPIYPVVNTLQQLVEPLHEEPATVIDDDGTPQAGFDHIACWVHYYIILGMILTAIYGAAVIARRSNNSRRLQKLDDAALGKDETAQTQGTETVKEA